MARNTSLGTTLRQYVTRAGASSDAKSDVALLNRFVATHDDIAFAALLARHGPMVFGVGRRVLRHSQDAEDVFQAAFLLLASTARSIRKGESVGSWLHGVAYHMALRVVSQRKVRKQREREAAISRSRIMAKESTLPELERALDEGLQRLPEIYRQAIIVCYLEGKGHEDASLILGCPVATLRSRLARGRKRLHAILTSQGVSISVGAISTVWQVVLQMRAALLRFFIAHLKPACNLPWEMKRGLSYRVRLHLSLTAASEFCLLQK